MSLAEIEANEDFRILTVIDGSGLEILYETVSTLEPRESSDREEIGRETE